MKLSGTVAVGLAFVIAGCGGGTPFGQGGERTAEQLSVQSASDAERQAVLDACKPPYTGSNGKGGKLTQAFCGVALPRNGQDRTPQRWWDAAGCLADHPDAFSRSCKDRFEATCGNGDKCICNDGYKLDEDDRCIPADACDNDRECAAVANGTVKCSNTVEHDPQQGHCVTTCKSGFVLAQGKCAPVTSCVPTTCTAQGKNCGTISDGCGGTLNCGSTCAAGQTCGGGGTANVCGAAACVPTTCTAQGKNCGTISDGCGGTLNCGSCSPSVIGISPSRGPAAGGTSVTITGANLSAASAVKFGTVEGEIISNSATQVVARSPVQTGGVVDITVTTAGGTSAAIPTDRFTYVTYRETVLSDAPSLYWRLGEASGTTAADSSGAGQDGTYSSGVTLGQSGALAGDPDNAVSLDGLIGSVQETSGAGVPTGSSPRSLEVWLKTTVATAQPLFHYGTLGPLSEFSVNVSSNQILVMDGTETLTFPVVSSLSDGVWHHLVVTYDGLAVSVYVDGTEVGVPESTSGVLATVMDATGFQLGRNATKFFSGALDEAAVYSTALTAGQVANHFHAGRGD